MRTLHASLLSLLLLASCGGDSFTTVPDGASGGGAGAGGTGSTGTGGTQASGGQGVGGTGTGGSVGTGTGGVGGGAGDGGAGAAGTGTSGTGGQGGAGSSGAAGSSACACPAPEDPCSIATCDGGGGCKTTENPSPPTLPQTAHDCTVSQCVSGKKEAVADPSDLPQSLGDCDAPGCNGVKPTHTDKNSKCPPTATCSGGKCNCIPCPSGPLAGLPSGTCRLASGATVAATAGEGTALAAVDGSATTPWKSQTYSPAGTEASLIVTPSGPTAVAAISINVDAYNPLSPGGTSEITVGVTVVDDATGGPISLGTITQQVPKGGDMFVFSLAKPTTIKQIQIQMNSKQTELSIFEVGYRTCK